MTETLESLPLETLSLVGTYLPTHSLLHLARCSHTLRAVLALPDVWSSVDLSVGCNDPPPAEPLTDARFANFLANVARWVDPSLGQIHRLCLDGTRITTWTIVRALQMPALKTLSVRRCSAINLYELADFACQPILLSTEWPHILNPPPLANLPLQTSVRHIDFGQDIMLRPRLFSEFRQHMRKALCTSITIWPGLCYSCLRFFSPDTPANQSARKDWRSPTSLPDEDHCHHCLQKATCTSCGAYIPRLRHGLSVYSARPFECHPTTKSTANPRGHRATLCALCMRRRVACGNPTCGMRQGDCRAACPECAMDTTAMDRAYTPCDTCGVKVCGGCKLKCAGCGGKVCRKCWEEWEERRKSGTGKVEEAMGATGENKVNVVGRSAAEGLGCGLCPKKT